MDVQFTRHAQAVMRERKIQTAWLQEALDLPEREDDESDGTVHYLKRISEFGNRWLRVVINPTTEPSTVVTVFFDRRVS